MLIVHFSANIQKGGDVTLNQIKYQELLETNRSNVARETETNRANLAGEALRERELAETNRHNVVTEQETYRSNLAREFETRRHNSETEDIQKLQAQEQARHNAATEANEAAKITLGYAQLAETKKQNAISNNFRATEANIQMQQFDRSLQQKEKADYRNYLANAYGAVSRANTQSVATGNNLISTITRLLSIQ